MMDGIKNFTVTCNSCGSNNVSLSGYCGQNTGYGYLNCENCDNEEESEN